MLKKPACDLLRLIYIPETLNLDDPYILHISDTPNTLFPALRLLIKRVNPKIIIHTGDLVDNFKIEFKQSAMAGYKTYLQRLVSILEDEKRMVYYTIGNHDNISLIKKFSKNAYIIPTYQTIDINGFLVTMIHNIEDLPIDEKHGDYIFFGHNLVQTSDYEGTPKYFNGIEKITLINMKTKQIFPLNYPLGTKKSRLNMLRRKF